MNRSETIVSLANRDRDLSIMLTEHADLFDDRARQKVMDAQAAISEAMTMAAQLTEAGNGGKPVKS